ncbi:uncharacterized protein LOC129338728 isoform X2 [Eublepharis macularius]|uniref:Uncharacterized protein LOC129338728 isoform X2 n=1 Tax=Eublepharis macularius TaxID=481883 RepID=A0AA97K3G6_EUBMA|nr:uncharacterized protein LOC129338728 isoform X2 [Eublepharis macularius]
MKGPRLKDDLMALDGVDAGALKRNVVHLLLRHPQGIKYGDFSGAFYKLHGHHPQLALHGYSSLKFLLTDMKDMVVLEKNSLETVIKVANGFHLNRWFDEQDGWSSSEEGLDSIDEEMQSLIDEMDNEAGSWCFTEGPRSQEPDSFVLIRDVIGEHPHGLKLSKLKQILNEKHGFDLEKFRVSLGCEDTLSLLEGIPGLLLQKRKNWVIQRQSDPCGPASSLDTDFSACNSVPQKMMGKKSVLAAALVPIVDTLRGHPNGLDLQTLKENLKKRGFDLENFSQDMGYDDTVYCLLEMPGLHLTFSCGMAPFSCVVQLLSHSLGRPDLPLSAGSSLHKPLPSSGSDILPQELMKTKPAAHSSATAQSNASLSCDSECSARTSKTLNQNGMRKKLVPAEVMALVTDVLNNYTLGLSIKKLKKFLLTLKGFDLEKCSIAHGYKDTLEFLEHQMPELKIRYDENREKCVVKGKEALPDPTSSPASQLNAGSASKSKTVNQNVLKKKPASAEVMALVTDLLHSYESGLCVKKLQKFLLTLKGFDLEKFSIAQGYKDTLDFLEHHISELKIRYDENRLKCVVKIKAGQSKRKKQEECQGSQEKTKKCPAVNSVPPSPDVQPQVGAEPTRTVGPQNATPDVGGVSKPSFIFGDVSVPEILAQKRSQASIPVPFTAIPIHPFSKEHHGASSGEAKSSFQAPSDIPAQPSSAGHFGGPPPARELSCPTDAQLLSQSSLTKPPHFEDLSEQQVKRQVARILAMHPEGMSLFQFRAAYSITFQHPLPLGNASSAKQRLLEMSDIVCMKGYGVQTLLLPVSPEELPPKLGLPVVSRVENAARVPAGSLPNTVASPGPVVLPVPSTPKYPVEPHSHSICSPSLDHPRAPDMEEKCVFPEGQLPRDAKMVAPLQDPARPKASLGGQPDLCKSENTSVNLDYTLPKPVVKVEPVVASKPSLPKTPVEPQPCSILPLAPDHFRIPDLKENCVLPKGQLQRTPLQQSVRPKASLGGQPDLCKSEEAAMNPCYSLPAPVVFPKPSVKPSSSEAGAEPVTQLYPSASSTSAYVRAPSNKESSFLPDSQLPRPSQPVALVGENVKARVRPRKNILIPHSPVVFPIEPQVKRLSGDCTSDGLPSRPMVQANPFFVNIPVPSLFQPVLTNFVAMAQPVVYPPDTRLPGTSANPSLAQPVPQSRPAQPTSPIRRMEQIDRTRTTHRIDHLQRASSTQLQKHSPAPLFSTDRHPISSPSVNPTSHQPFKSHSVESSECVHHTRLCSSVSTADNSVVAAPSARLHSKPVVPVCQKQYVSVNSLVTTTSTQSSASHQSASSPFNICTESDTQTSKPIVSMPQPHHTLVNSALASSNSQQSPLLPSRGSPARRANQPSSFSFRANTDYDASPQRKTLPGISSEGSERDSHWFTLPDNQKYHVQEPTKPYAFQTSPPPQNSDRCVIL